jgi:hypothetical protein
MSIRNRVLIWLHHCAFTAAAIVAPMLAGCSVPTDSCDSADRVQN